MNRVNVAFLVFVLATAGIWFALIGRAGPPEWIFGAAVVLSAWWLFDRLSEFGNHVPASRAWAFFHGVGGYFLGHVVGDVVRSTFRVFREVLRARIDVSPAIVAVPLPEATPAALMLLAYGTSLTPGQLVVAIDEERRILYVHALDVPDPDAMRREITRLYHRYIKEGTQW
jgi:multicomponent Na+:H+ antiporter subunit E